MRNPGGVLGEIVARKQADVAARLAGVDIADLRSRAVPTPRDLRTALARPGARFIMEVKKASPSHGAIRVGADPAAIARAYGGSADAVSVLTDQPYFGGSLDDLAVVRSAFSGPILAKDFVVDPRQVVEARIHGADAVLVMLSVLEDEEARAIMAEAARLNMAVLVETHDEEEVKRAVALGAAIIGINNRDLRTLETDLLVTERLSRLVPDDRLVVSESGIHERRDAARLAPFCDAFLVGSSLMAAPDPAHAARALAFGRVKICGLTTPGDARAAAAAGATYAGIILAQGSPRTVTPAIAEEIAAAARREGSALVSVVQDQDLGFVAETARRLRVQAVQLHGSESAAYADALRKLLPAGTEIWGAVGIQGKVVDRRDGVDRHLFDSRVNGRTGGTGSAFDWSLVEGRLGTAILAGGIGPANAAAAAARGAFALDVASGVEGAPGRKDAGKLAALFEALRLPARGEKRC